MKIHALTVCVNYAPLLALSIERWLSGVSTLTVVTDFRDTATRDLCDKHDVLCWRTDVFYERGATFNKGAAIAEAYRFVPKYDWLLFFDADIVPPEGWRRRVDAAGCRPGNLYGAWRHQCDTPEQLGRVEHPRIREDVPGVGYFQLFHESDPNAQTDPIVDTHWTHAGNYDSEFRRRWAPSRIRCIKDLDLVHVGERDNWWGLGNKEAFARMQEERRRRGGRWDHETIDRA